MLFSSFYFYPHKVNLFFPNTLYESKYFLETSHRLFSSVQKIREKIFKTQRVLSAIPYYHNFHSIIPNLIIYVVLFKHCTPDISMLQQMSNTFTQMRRLSE